MGIDALTYTTFVVTVTVLCVTPGPDMLYVLSQGVSRGPRAGLVSAAGLSVGMVCHTVLVAVGTAALIQSSPFAFQTLRITGAAYLLYLAWHTLRASDGTVVGTEHDQWHGLSRTFRRAVWVNLLNPKVVLFYLAFLPQFINVTRGGTRMQLLALGGTFAVIGLVIDSVIGIMAGHVGRRLTEWPKAGPWLNRFAGMVLLGLAVRTALV